MVRTRRARGRAGSSGAAALGDAALATAALTRAIVDRSARYTSERGAAGAPRDRIGDLAARAVFFSVADAMKIGVPLGELAGRGALPAAARCASWTSAPAAAR